MLLPILMLLPYPLLRIPFGLLLVLWVPGYGLTAALFVQADDLRPVERSATSIGLSAAILPLMALLLDRLPWGIALWPMVSVLAGWSVVCTIVAFVRRRRLLARPDHPVVFGLAGIQARRIGRLIRPIPILVGLATLVAVFAVSNVLDRRSQADLTEFYMLGASGDAEDYPQTAIVNQPLSLTIGVINREHIARTYRIAGYSSSSSTSAREQVLEVKPFTVEAGATYQAEVAWAMPRVGPDQSMEIALYTNGQEQPYRSLRIVLSVTSVPSQP